MRGAEGGHATGVRLSPSAAPLTLFSVSKFRSRLSIAFDHDAYIMWRRWIDCSQSPRRLGRGPVAGAEARRHDSQIRARHGLGSRMPIAPPRRNRIGGTW